MNERHLVFSHEEITTIENALRIATNQANKIIDQTQRAFPDKDTRELSEMRNSYSRLLRSIENSEHDV